MFACCAFFCRRWPALLVLVARSTIVVGGFRTGDVISTTYRTTTGSEETPWEEALRSQMPRFGRSGTVRFRPTLPAATADGAPRSANEEEDEKLAISFAFSEDRLFLRQVALVEGGGGEQRGRRRLSKLVVTFASAGGDVVRVRSDPVYEDRAGSGGDGGDGRVGALDFNVEYRWDRIPEEDEQAGVWLVFATSLLLTVALAIDTCNGTSGGDGSDWSSPPPPSTSSSSSSRRGGGDRATTGRVGSGGGVLRPAAAGREEEWRRRR